MEELLFGTGGTPHSSPKPRNLINGIRRIAELGLGCMEMEFVYGVRLPDSEAEQVAATARKLKVRLTAHAPYYINLNAHENDKLVASQDKLLQTAHTAALCGASDVAFHAAFYLKDPPEEVYARLKRLLTGIVSEVKRENKYIWLRPELMGKPSQFGSLEELLALCSEVEGLAPCIDFAHLHARTGKYNSYYEFNSVLSQVEKRLGRSALDNLHIHVSGINYNNKSGEIMHLNLRESDFRYIDLLRALKERDVRGTLICESPNLEEDALLLKETYAKV
ncbi:MAG: TIM barrel protein [Dehalococcoidales bacterium]|jgi:deoxyribonuclease-4|nr:TIM barrel protein [Dehalococcoidales bacterium]